MALIKVWLKKQQNVFTSLMSLLNYEFLHFLLDTWIDIHGVPTMSVKGYVSICRKIKCLMNFFFFFFREDFGELLVEQHIFVPREGSGSKCYMVKVNSS